MRQKENLIDYLTDFYNNESLDSETENLVLNFLTQMGVDIRTI